MYGLIGIRGQGCHHCETELPYSALWLVGINYLMWVGRHVYSWLWEMKMVVKFAVALGSDVFQIEILKLNKIVAACRGRIN